MQKSFFILNFMVLSGLIQAETPHFYPKKEIAALSSYDTTLIEHAKNSFTLSLQRISKLTNTVFSSDTSCNSVYGTIPYYHLLNNLCSMENASHLHIGLYTGGSFVGALYGNEEILKDKIGIDWFRSDWNYPTTFYTVCEKYLTKEDYQVVSSDCFAIDKSIFKRPIDIYVYDADHATIAHTMAFTYYNEVLADTFIAIVDDWSWEQVRQGTFDAFDQLGYQVIWQDEIPHSDTQGNGQYIAVIKK